MSRRKIAAKNALDDLVMLDSIKEDKILECLRNRYLADEIYTNIGPVLIAINPFKKIPTYYTEAKIREYRGKKFYELPPHVYALADETYNSMINYRENQCCIISGESGSGKTETSKIIMQYLSAVSGRSEEVVRVKERMLSSNPILEAFGNAKTVNNNNSSRFGKYMEILFDYGGDPVGGRVTNYLLEKSRVVSPAKNERNFHVFYQFCNMTGADKGKWYLEGPDYYYYLSQSECYTVPGIDDSADFKEVQESLTTIGITDAEKDEVTRVISSVLWLGNVAFTEDKKESAAIADANVLNIVATLLEVDGKALEKSLITRRIQTGIGSKAEVFTKPNTQAAADFCRDTLAKALYSKLFDWLVKKINLSIKKEGWTGVLIGVLDIYGFEIFVYNSFEQLCINFVNEKLQQIFIELTLKAEQEEYKAEGIPWKDISYYNNKPICDLIELKPGLLTVLDDCCNTAKTDQMFVQDLSSFFSSNPALRCGSNDFTISHYAGDVRYVSENFTIKNKDTLFDDLTLVMQSTSAGFARDQGWMDIEITDGQKKRPITVGAQFQKQVQALMTALKACVPHYIRCIKPNMEKTPMNFSDHHIGKQVQYLGLLENVRVRRAGYAHRSIFSRFLKRYAILNREVFTKTARGDDKKLCDTLVKGLGWSDGKEYAMGKTKIFIQDAATLFLLEDMVDRKINDAVIIGQKAWRKYKQKRYYLEMKAAGYDVVNRSKQRRRASIDRDYKGDYLDFSYNHLVSALLQAAGPKEKVLFADKSRVGILKGKKSLLGRLFGKDGDPLEHRFLLLSDKAVYSFQMEVELPEGAPAGSKPAPGAGRVRAKLFWRVAINQIGSINLSPLADNFMVFRFTDGQTRDQLVTCRRKTEFLGVLVTAAKSVGKTIAITFNSAETIVVDPKNDKKVEVKWVLDETIPAGKERMLMVKHNVEIHVASGMPGTSVREPHRPAAFDPSSVQRASLKALYDCPGNGVDELAFKTDDILYVVKDAADGWYEAELNGKKGFVPESYVERLKVKKATGAAPGSRAGAGAGAGGVRTPGGAGAAPAKKKKSPWKAVPSADGTYYHNEETDETSWDVPPGFGDDGKEEEAPPEEKKGPRPPGGGTAATAARRPSTTAKPCAVGGCPNARFGGKPYCVSHASSGGGATASSSGSTETKRPAKAGGGFSAPPPSFGGAPPPTFTAPPPSFGAPKAASTPTPPPAAATPSPSPAKIAIPAKTAGGIPAGGRPPAAGAGGAPKAAGSPAPAKLAAGIGAGIVMPKMGGAPKFGGGSATVSASAATAAPPLPAGAPPTAPTPAPAKVGLPAFKPPTPPQAPAKKKSDWVKTKDESSGEDYYYNEKTNETSWDKPADYW